MTMTRNVSPAPYNQNYKNLAFYIWYQNGRPSMPDLARKLDVREDGTKPAHLTVGKWKRDNNWEQKADELDQEAAIQIQKRLIDDRVKMFEEHAELGEALRVEALYWLGEHGVTTANEAMRLLTIAVDIERESIGLSDIIAKIKDMDDSGLKDRIAYLMKKGRLTDLDTKTVEKGEDVESTEFIE